MAFFLVINELPFAERFKLENMILAGLWFGSDSKPTPNLFLSPLYDEMRKIFSGIEVIINDTISKIRGIIICGTCDLPAKGLFLCMTNYNGKCGCSKCKQRGEKIEHRWVYRYKKNLELRTDEETATHAQEAMLKNDRVYGIRFPSILSRFVYACFRSTGVDAMHSIFGGSFKQNLHLLFDPQYADEPFSLHRYIELVDKRLLALKLPNFVQRCLRSISDHLSYFKSSEFKTIFFNVALPIFEDIMEPEYFKHFKLLVAGISYLMQDSVSPEMVNKAEKALKKYVRDFQKLYGLKYMGANIHSIQHLCLTVKQSGPLYTTSCFPLESALGQMKKSVHSSNSAQLQIFNSISLLMNFQTLINEDISKESDAYKFCKKVLSNGKKLKKTNLFDSISALGKISKISNIACYRTSYME